MDTSLSRSFPSVDGSRPDRCGSPQSLAILSLAALSAAIVVARFSVALDQGVHGWDMTYWLFAVVPPVYLILLWLSAWRTLRRDLVPTRKVTLLSLSPLVLWAIPILLVAIDSIARPMRYAWSDANGWLIVDLVSWTCVSVIVVGYFVHLVWRTPAEPKESDEP